MKIFLTLYQYEALDILLRTIDNFRIIIYNITKIICLQVKVL